MQGNDASGSSNPSSPVRKPDREALPAGARLGDYEIVRTVGSGGFGKVYLAHDHVLDRDVAIKEYLPAQLACRTPELAVAVRAPEFTDNYAAGLRSFVNEAKILAHFNHPAVVKVHRFWEANGTAYMVMPFVHGPTLRDVRRSMRTAPTEAWLRGVLDPLLDALAMLHAEGVYHRDIAPDNVLLPGAHEPVLLDFGAARRVLGDRTQTLTAVLKPSYAPIEQYAEATQVRQGPWTDLYALGAVIHYLLHAAPPPPSTVRSMHDEMRLLTDRPPPGVSTTFLAAVQWALAVRPQDRPQSVQQLRKALDGQMVPPPPRIQTLLRDTDGAPLRLPVADAAPEDLMNPGTAWAEEAKAFALEADAPAFPQRGSATWDTTIRLASERPQPLPPKAPAVANWMRAMSSQRGSAVLAVGAFAIVGAGMLAMLRDSPPQPSASTWRELAQQANKAEDAPVVSRLPAPQPLRVQTVASLPPLPPDPAPRPAKTETPLKTMATVATRPEQIPLLQTLAANEELVESARRTPVVVLADGMPLVRTAALRAPDKRSTQPALKKVSQPRSAKPMRLGPNEACSDRSFFTRPFCVHRKCEEPQFRKHPQCVELQRRYSERAGARSGV
jgi:serine/threonine protein kinase